MFVAVIQKKWDDASKQYIQEAKDKVETTPGQLFSMSPLRIHGIIFEEQGNQLEITTYRD